MVSANVEKTMVLRRSESDMPVLSGVEAASAISRSLSMSRWALRSVAEVVALSAIALRRFKRSKSFSTSVRS